MSDITPLAHRFYLREIERTAVPRRILAMRLPRRASWLRALRMTGLLALAR